MSSFRCVEDNSLKITAMDRRMTMREKYTRSFPNSHISYFGNRGYVHGLPICFIDCHFTSQQNWVDVFDPPSSVVVDNRPWYLQMCDTVWERSSYKECDVGVSHIIVGVNLHTKYTLAYGRFIRCRFADRYITESMITDGNMFQDCKIIGTSCIINTVERGKHSVTFRGRSFVVRDGDLRKPGDFETFFIKNMKTMFVRSAISVIYSIIAIALRIVLSMVMFRISFPDMGVGSAYCDTKKLIVWFMSCGEFGFFNLGLFRYVLVPFAIVGNVIRSQLVSVGTVLSDIMRPTHKKYNCYWCVVNDWPYQRQRKRWKMIWINIAMFVFELPMAYMVGILVGRRLILVIAYLMYAIIRFATSVSVENCRYVN